jgi:hypothetical protein
MIRLVAATVAVILLLAASVNVLAAGPAAASSRYGVLLDFARTDDPETLREAFSRMRDAGIGWLRIDFFWHVIEPRPGELRWDRYDAIVRTAGDHGIEILGILDYTAPWASRDPAARDDKQPPRDPALFGRYAALTVARYRDRVAAWQVWNEPDHAEFWKGSAEDYARLLAHVYPAIKAANPAATIVIGGLAEGGTYDPGFLDSVLVTCRALGHPCFDVFAFHINFRDAAAVRRQFAANRQRLTAHGLRPPIWITEASYPSDRRHQTVPGYQDGELSQARYLAETLALGLELGATRVFWATLYDYRRAFGPYSMSGLLTVDGRPKRAWDAYRRLATGR